MNTITLNTVSLNRVSPNRVQLNSTGAARKKERIDYIKFVDPEVERICLANFDMNGDGKIQFTEASAVTTFVDAFKNNKTVKIFNEIQYFDNPQCNMGSKMQFSGLEEVKVTKIASNVITALYQYCYSLKNAEIGEITNAPSVAYIFGPCSNLKVAKLFNLKKVKSMVGTFNGCQVLERVEFDDLSGITSLNATFSNCYNLVDFVVERLPNIALSLAQSSKLSRQSIETILNALPQSTTFPTLTLHVDAIDRYEEVYGIESVEDACIEKGWSLAESGSRQGIAFSDNECKRVMISNFDEDGNGNVDIREAYEADSFYELFNNNTAVVKIDGLKYFPNIRDFYRAFKGCTNLVSIDINEMDMSNATTIYSLFSTATKITEIDMSNCDLSNVTDVQWAFNRCTSLETLKMDNVELTSCTTAYNAFAQCSALKDFTIRQLPNANVSFSESTKLTVQSVGNIINALPRSASFPVLTLHVEAIDRYEELYGVESVENACIEKGWTLVYA